MGRLPAPADSLQQDVYREQQLTVVRHQLSMGLINIFNGMLVAAGAATKVPLTNVLIWYTPIFLMGIVQILSWLKMRNAPPPKRVTGSYLRKAEIATLFVGTVWGSASLFLSGDGEAAT